VVDFKGQKLGNKIHVSSTDPEARLFRKSKGDKSRLCYMGHALMENRDGLVVSCLIYYRNDYNYGSHYRTRGQGCQPLGR
jgi:hypothetical protein